MVAADVRGRLFGIPLLRLTAEVLLAPASVRDSMSWTPPAHRWKDTSASPARPPAARLADAQQLLRDSETLLAQAREASG